jgi:hypothetical protein
MTKWRSPAVIVTAVAAVVGVALFVANDRDRKRAIAECQTEEATEDCKQNRALGGVYALPGGHGRAAPRAMTGQVDSNAPMAANAADAQEQGQTQRSGFGATGRSRGFSGG